VVQSSGRAEAGEPGSGRAASPRALWAEVQIDPVEIALPSGVGFTLRAYRPAADVAAPDAERDAMAVDEFDAAAAAVAARRVSNNEGGIQAGGRVAGDWADAEDLDEPDFDEVDDEIDEEASETDDELEAGETSDIPLFLGRRGRLYLFHSPDKLVEFVRSDVEHDLTQLETWSDLADRVGATDIEPLDEDSYELDLVVENLRGGSDVWEPTLILKAGELARDLGYALRIEPVLTALAPGSPLDDLDDSLRAVDNGGVGGFLARRRLRKVPAQQSALAWRTIIGKISAAVDWRD